tara:strand:- start:1593 stop:2282 length:690 start_codon:yes stop_codon:yes gene_type:complete
MQLFYLENPQDEIKLGADESKHITKVLRKKAGSILHFTNGRGRYYRAEITLADKTGCKLKIVRDEFKEKQHKYHLHIAIAPTKNINRFEWFLEKATEIGIDEITPIICDRSERRTIKTERSKRVLLSAMKQSVKYYLPKINEAIPLSSLLNSNSNESKYIAHCIEGGKVQLKEIKTPKRILILIGPEGDFTQKEINLALKNGFKAISLGTSRLRTETAGVIATHTINIK